MIKFSKHKNFGFAILVSVLLVIAVKASAPYSVNLTKLNDSEFPRIQMSMNVSGDTNGLVSKHFEILEDESVNVGPQVLLPPHDATNKIDLRILVDTSGRTSSQEALIRNNLKSLVTYIFASEMDASIYLSSLDGVQAHHGTKLQDVLNNINSLAFSDEITPKIDGFTKIRSEAGSAASSGAQKILLILNGSDFEDDKSNGIYGSKMTQAIVDVSNNNYLTFVLGHPLRKIHAAKADDKDAELASFSQMVPGGYLGGFGADLTTMVDLIKMQSSNDFVLQYYTSKLSNTFAGTLAKIRILGYDAYNFAYSSVPSNEISVNHLPKNELVLGEDVVIDVDLGNGGKMINAVEVNYFDKEDDLKIMPLIHKRAENEEGMLKYSGSISADLVDDENFSYTISVHTPYSSIAGNGLITIPVNAYDDGIILTPMLVNNEEVLWKWEGPTVAMGKKFEVWSGDTLLTPTPITEKHFTIPLTECNRYQIIQVKVLLKDSADHPKAGDWSYPSRPYEYYADAGEDGPITERNAVTIMINCIEEKEIDTYTKIAASTQGFSADTNLKMDRAGIYLAKIIAEDIWKNIEGQSGYYELLYYIMIFINQEEYVAHGVEKADINESLVHKLITKVNNSEDINEVYNKALAELTNRLRSTLSL